MWSFWFVWVNERERLDRPGYQIDRLRESTEVAARPCICDRVAQQGQCYRCSFVAPHGFSLLRQSSVGCEGRTPWLPA